MIIYNEILKKLSSKGWTTYRLKKEKILSGSIIDRLRESRPITTETINVICNLCECQPGELLSWRKDENPEN